MDHALKGKVIGLYYRPHTDGLYSSYERTVDSSKATEQDSHSFGVDSTRQPVENAAVAECDSHELKIVFRMVAPLSITAVNLLDPAEFTRVFGNVVEYAPSIASVLARRRPLRDTQHLLAELYSIIDGLSDSGK